MKAAPNRYHCSSSQAFDEMSKTLRMTALPALTRIETRIAQETHLPTNSFSASMVFEIVSRRIITSPLRQVRSFSSGPPNAPGGRFGWGVARRRRIRDED